MTQTPNSIKTLLVETRAKLESISESPALDAELLLSHCLQKERSYLHTWPERELDQTQLNCFDGLIQKRLTDYPVAYLLGTKAFWTLDLIVTPDVLIPRPETELLVEVALEKIKAIKNPAILDLGTGSGAIALALASERSDALITATDASENALDIAFKNAEKHKLSKQVQLIKSNWFSQIPSQQFDLIVSNPPYISPDDPHLSQTIRHEPKQALVADNEGIKDIETIIKDSTSFLKAKSWLILEHGYNQSEQALKLFSINGFACEETLNDLNNNPRLTLARLKK